MDDVTVHIGILYVSLFIRSALSLKEKRMVLRQLKDRIRSRFNISVAELDGHDKWQVATLGFSMIGVDSKYIDKSLQHILSIVHSYHAVEICKHEIELL